EPSFIKNKYKDQAYIPKNIQQWGQCCNEYVAILRDIYRSHKDKILVDSNINKFTNNLNADPSNLLHTILKLDAPYFIYYLWKSGANFFEITEQRKIPTIVRCIENKKNLSFVILYYNEVDSNYIDNSKNNLLHIAAQCNNEVIYKFFIDNQAYDISIKNDMGQTAKDMFE
ncbi:MAG: hypothetical protein MHPSP_004285, partial [Paramarteilia canceri]